MVINQAQLITFLYFGQKKKLFEHFLHLVHLLSFLYHNLYDIGSFLFVRFFNWFNNNKMHFISINFILRKQYS